MTSYNSKFIGAASVVGPSALLKRPACCMRRALVPTGENQVLSTLQAWAAASSTSGAPSALAATWKSEVLVKTSDIACKSVVVMRPSRPPATCNSKFIAKTSETCNSKFIAK